MIPKLLHGVHSSHAPSIIDRDKPTMLISTLSLNCLCPLGIPPVPCLLPSDSTPQQQNFWLSHQAYEQCPSLKSDSHSVQMAINAALIPITMPNKSPGRKKLRVRKPRCGRNWITCHPEGANDLQQKGPMILVKTTRRHYQLVTLPATPVQLHTIRVNKTSMSGWLLMT